MRHGPLLFSVLIAGLVSYASSSANAGDLKAPEVHTIEVGSGALTLGELAKIASFAQSSPGLGIRTPPVWSPLVTVQAPVAHVYPWTASPEGRAAILLSITGSRP